MGLHPIVVLSIPHRSSPHSQAHASGLPQPPSPSWPHSPTESRIGSCGPRHTQNLIINVTLQTQVASHAASTGQHSPVEAFLGVIKSAFPDNVFAAAVNMNVLGVRRRWA